LKGPKGFHISILVIFFCQKNSITLQKVWTSFIWLQVADFWHGKIRPTNYK
jgi:hypothetical protein